MALTERLMGLEQPKIPVHYFYAANDQRIEGLLTRQQVIDMFQLNAAAITEYDQIAALAPTGSTTAAIANKAMFIDKIHAIYLLAEGRFTGYSTPAEVKTKIGI